MRNPFTLLVATVVAVVLLTYMFLFTVRYDEVAVVTRFDRATAPLRDEQGMLVRDAAGNVQDPGSLVLEPGLNLRWPWPIDKVHKFSKRIQFLEMQLQETYTADNKSVILRVDMMWRIEDPLAFFVTLQNANEAQRQLRSVLSDAAQTLTGQYRFDQFVNIDVEQLAIGEFEQRVAELVNQNVTQQGFGVQVQRVVLRRMSLPEQVTAKVFERMKKTRERMAANARESGRNQATAIRSEADAIKKRILAFAQRRASAIRTQGDREASEHYSVFQANEDFSNFLRNLDALKQMLQGPTTFVLPAEQIPPMDYFVTPPLSKQTDNADAQADRR